MRGVVVVAAVSMVGRPTLYGLIGGLISAALVGMTLKFRGKLTCVLVPLLATAVLLVATPAAARADTFDGWVWQETPAPGLNGTGNASCGEINRQLTSTTGQGHPWLETNGTVWWAWNGAPCANGSNFVAPGSIVVKQWLWAFRYDYGRALCNEGPQVTNPQWAVHVDTGFGWPALACPWLGTNWYSQFSELWYGNEYGKNGSINYTWVS